MAVLKLEHGIQSTELKLVLFAPSLNHFFPRLNKIKFGKESNSVVIVNKLCHSWRKDFNRSWAIIKYMFSNYGEFSFFDRTKTRLNYILWCRHLHALLRVFCQCRVFCFIVLKIPNCCTIAKLSSTLQVWKHVTWW